MECAARGRLLELVRMGFIFLGNRGGSFTHLYAISSKNENLEKNFLILHNEIHASVKYISWTFSANLNSLNNFIKKGIRSGIWGFSYFHSITIVIYLENYIFAACCKILQKEIKLLINFSFVISDLLKMFTRRTVIHTIVSKPNVSRKQIHLQSYK